MALTYSLYDSKVQGCLRCLFTWMSMNCPNNLHLQFCMMLSSQSLTNISRKQNWVWPKTIYRILHKDCLLQRAAISRQNYAYAHFVEIIVIEIEAHDTSKRLYDNLLSLITVTRCIKISPL